MALTKLNFATIRRVIQSSPYRSRTSTDTMNLVASNERFVHAYGQLCPSSNITNPPSEELPRPVQPDETTDPSDIENTPSTVEAQPINEGNQAGSLWNRKKPWLTPKDH